MMAGCSAGEDAKASGTTTKAQTLEIDYATYNPLSLVIKDKGWLEQALGEDVKVTWVFSAGSNKANESLRAGAVDVGSTAGSAALLARSNGSPIQVIDLFSQPEWSALVTRPDSGVAGVDDLAGRSVAATKGTDPYFVLLQALDEAGVAPGDVTVQNLQHADGRRALDNGDVDAWAGLDPIMADAERGGDVLFYRNVDFNSYGFLNATEDFLENQPEVAQTVVDVYEYARQWALEHPEETAQILATEADIDPEVATAVLQRTHLDIDNVPGQKQLDVLRGIGPFFVANGDVKNQAQVDDALGTIVHADLAEHADASRVAGALEKQ
ncbi:aliphatic sulfonate ABC transporter substrate-binding protein [Georgenia ruanii]|uniref:Aliphatic sulfonate ABC transporter substrate-binding protein n=2 Tax=Georgenia ruanii TaxID=348442 RepID=A0A7J9UXP3_9MICO|nr:aliphatic sulfonate ABC transporter substrate-binding protein [Georgenia ruanii]MPV89405.1 aliphatic sulfonate ABC transporter substrate-binding protein [Georgenia ruanii]